MKPRVWKAFLVLAVCAGVARAQDNLLEQYHPGTVSEMVRLFSATTKGNKPELFSEDGFMTVARVKFAGRSRKVSPQKQAFLNKWLKNNHYPDDFTRKFQEEYLFHENGVDYWLVSQDVVVPHLVAEVKPGDAVDLYLILLGSVRQDTQPEPVILLNEFKRAGDERPSGPRTGRPGKPEQPPDRDVLKGFEDYKRRTLKEIVDAHSNSNAITKSNVLLTGDTFSSRVRLIYTGKTRPIEQSRKFHLELLIKSFDAGPQTIARYEEEMLVREGAEEHWLPFLKELKPHFEKEVKGGEEVTLYVEWVGATKLSGKWEWIFIVNEFQK